MADGESHRLPDDTLESWGDDKRSLRRQQLVTLIAAAGNLVGKPLMKVFGIEMDDLVKVKPGHGVAVQGNDLLLDPEQLVPPPKIRGKVTELSFGSAS